MGFLRKYVNVKVVYNWKPSRRRCYIVFGHSFEGCGVRYLETAAKLKKEEDKKNAKGVNDGS